MADLDNEVDDTGSSDSKREDQKALFSKKLKNVKPGRNTVSRKLAAFWKDEVELVDKNNSKWLKRGQTVIKRYRDERSLIDSDTQRRMNLLWTNTKIMMPALLGKCPQAIAERKHLDQDPVGRLSAQMLERGLRTQIEDNGYYAALRRAVLDYLLPGRGQVWVRYEPEVGYGDSLVTASNAFSALDKIEEDYGLEVDDDEQAHLDENNEEIVAESVPVDYLNWQDFYMFPATARIWEEVQAVGKKVYISKAEAIERFGEDIGNDIRPDTTHVGAAKSKSPFADSIVLQDINARDLVVFEIWNKTDRRAYWISPGYDFLCDVKDDPLKLKRFFPVPAPLDSTMTNETMTPVPDFMEWQDQAIQIDELTQRIAMLTKSCKIAGTYDASNSGLKRILDESVENQLIPVDSWAAHADKGGVAGSISFLPIKEIQEVIQTLTDVRKEVKIDLDEVTGLSDVLRGTTDSRETLGGLRLKNNNAGTRLQDKQNEVARFARDVIELMAEVMCKHFSDETLIECSGIKFEEALQPNVVMTDFQAETMEKLQNNPQLKQLFGGGGGPPNMGNQQPVPPPQGSSPPLMPGTVPHAPMNMQPGQPQAPQGQQTPPPQQGAMPGNNVVPFKPQGGPMQPSPLQPQQPQLDPKMIIMHMLQQQMAQITPDMLIKAKIDKAIKLLRDEITRNYRIDIETDSTVFGDSMQERQDATELVTALTGFFGQAEALTASLPEAIPLFGKTLSWAFRKYRVGRDLETAVDNFVRVAEKKAKDMMANPQQNPEQAKMAAEIQKIQLTAQTAKETQQSKAQLDLAVTSQKAQMQQQNDERDAQRQAQNDQREFALDQQRGQMELGIEQEKVNLERQKMGMEMHAQTQEHQLHANEIQMEQVAGAQQHQQTMQQDNMQHQHSIEAHHQETHKMHAQAAVDQQKHKQTMEHGAAAHKQKMTAAKKPKPTGKK